MGSTQAQVVANPIGRETRSNIMRGGAKCARSRWMRVAANDAAMLGEKVISVVSAEFEAQVVAAEAARERNAQVVAANGAEVGFICSRPAIQTKGPFVMEWAYMYDEEAGRRFRLRYYYAPEGVAVGKEW